jgi:hypothetical protein
MTVRQLLIPIPDGLAPWIDLDLMVGLGVHVPG